MPWREEQRKAVAGKLHARFDEGGQAKTCPLLYPAARALLGTPGAGKAMRENPAFEIAAELAFDMGWAG